MPTEYFQSFDTRTGSFDSADVVTCRVVIPFSHYLVSAVIYPQNVDITGTNEITLRFTDILGPRGGNQIGTELENDDLTAKTNINQKYSFTLSADDKRLAPADRMYFVQLSASSSTARWDEPTLIIEVNRA